MNEQVIEQFKKELYDSCIEGLTFVNRRKGRIPKITAWINVMSVKDIPIFYELEDHVFERVVRIAYQDFVDGKRAEPKPKPIKQEPTQPKSEPVKNIEKPKNRPVKVYEELKGFKKYNNRFVETKWESYYKYAYDELQRTFYELATSYVKYIFNLGGRIPKFHTLRHKMQTDHENIIRCIGTNTAIQIMKDVHKESRAIYEMVLKENKLRKKNNIAN